MDDERNYEEEALAQGWNPDFDGPNKSDAKTFVEKGEKIAGILKSKVDRQGRQIENLIQSNKEFGEYHKTTLKAQHKKDAGRIEELELKIAQAITDGDGQVYTNTRREIDDLKSTQEVATDDATAWNNMAQSWARDNQWYSENHKLAVYADGLSDQIRQEGYNGQAYFSELTRRVQEDFPEEFSNPNKNKPASVEGGGPVSEASKERSYANLPDDAKAACNDFVKQGFMTKEAYVATYEFDE